MGHLAAVCYRTHCLVLGLNILVNKGELLCVHRGKSLCFILEKKRNMEIKLPKFRKVLENLLICYVYIHES